MIRDSQREEEEWNVLCGSPSSSSSSSSAPRGDVREERVLVVARLCHFKFVFVSVSAMRRNKRRRRWNCGNRQKKRGGSSSRGCMSLSVGGHLSYVSLFLFHWLLTDSPAPHLTMTTYERTCLYVNFLSFFLIFFFLLFVIVVMLSGPLFIKIIISGALLLLLFVCRSGVEGEEEGIRVCSVFTGLWNMSPTIRSQSSEEDCHASWREKRSAHSHLPACWR